MSEDRVTPPLYGPLANDADLDEALFGSRRRTVTVRTLDHGLVTVPEPAWCTGEHQQGEYQADLHHYGPETPLSFRGVEVLGAALGSHPFAERLPRGPMVYVEMGGFQSFADPAEVRQLADALVGHAAVLCDLAGDLAALLDDEEGQR
jgi:hypothetical protein